jgi:probable phosphoglycerate mutase
MLFMAQILLIRPGATEYDQQGRVQGTLDIPLCEDGRQEVAGLVAELRDQPISAVYASPCQSAAQTAEALAGMFELKFKTLDKLQNLDQGLWQGMLVDEVKTKQPKVYRQWQDQPEMVCPPQGETLSAAKQRVQAALARLLKKHKSGELLAIVAPEPLASVIRNVLGHDGWGNLWRCATDGARWELLQLPEPAEAK